jgi:Transmembrane protein 43
MSENSYTVTSSTGWFGRIGGAIKGVLFGLLMIVVSFPVLFLNEGRAVKTRKTLDEGSKSVVAVSAETVDAKNDGKLVYLTGDAVVEGVLADPDFTISAAAVNLRRKVEMFQWKENEKTETKKKLGGGEEQVTTYSYEKVWSDRAIDSSGFFKKQGYENPEPALEGKAWSADPVMVGAFKLPPGLVGKIDNYTQVGNPAVELPEEIAGKKAHYGNGGFYLGESPEAPAIGDLRVSHEAAMPGTVSVIAKQASGSFEPFVAKAGGTIEMLETGLVSADAMFTAAHQANKFMTWILRLVGFILMLVGFSLLFRPLSVLADVVPMIGNIVGAGTGFIAFLLSLPLSLLVISVAWIFYRPLIGIPLVVAAIAGFVFLIRTLMAQKKKRAAIA